MTEQTLPIEYLKTISVQELLDFRHSSCDVFLVLSGSVSLTTETGTTQYCENDLVILNAGSSCTLEAQEKNALLCLGISSWFVEQCLGSYGMIFCDSVQEPRSSCLALKQLMRGISAAYLEDSKKNFLSIYSQLYQFMSLLKKYHCFAMPVDKDIPKKYHSRVEKLINYVNLNYDKPLSLLDLAEALHLSPQYLSKFFKQYLHKNFKEFLLEKRLFHASREVRYTDMPITDIAIHCGFPDIATFNRAFRDAFSMTPGQYRKSVRNQHLTADYNDFEMDRREVLPTTPPYPTPRLLLSVCPMKASLCLLF